MEISHKQLSVMLRRCYEKDQPLMIHGTIGIGKSMYSKNIWKDFAKEKGREFVEWCKADIEKKSDILNHAEKYLVFVDDRVALKDSTDNKGIPKLIGEYLEWVKTMIMNISAKKNSMVIWFKDELNLAPPSVQAAEYQIILDKALDDLSFADNTYIYAAGNRQEDNSNVFDMSWALRNRFAHVTLRPPTHVEWGAWAMSNKLDSRIITFITKVKSEYLIRLPDANADEDAFPTPRSLHKASNMIEGIEGKTDDELKLIQMFVASNVGDSFAKEFVAWIRLNQNVDLDAILNNPKEIKKIERIDLLTSVISSLAERYNRDNELLRKVLAVSIELKPEFAVHMVRLVKSMNKSYFGNNAPKFQEFKDIAKYHIYLDDFTKEIERSR